MADKVCIENLNIEKFSEEGLYLIFPNNDCIPINQKEIEDYFIKVWNDSSVFPPHIKEAADLDFCSHCPGKETDEFCVAIRPILPFLKKVDQYVSFDKVTAIMRTENPTIISITHTDLQYALKYVALMSLVMYCETNQKFWPYYFGIHPFSDIDQILSQIYINIFWLNDGDLDKTKQAIYEFKTEIQISDECLIKRLRLICKNDAFLNAFTMCQVSSEYLSMDEEELLRCAFGMHNRRLGHNAT